MDVSRTRALRLLAPLAALALLTACSDSGSAEKADTSTRQAAQAAVPASSSDLQSDYQKVIKDVLPSVVQIQASSDLGSGVVYDDKGHVVTNAHVVGNEKTFKVTTAGSEDTLTAKLVYSYPEQDLAVIKLDKVPDGLKAAAFADSSKVQVGQIVLAMGSPLGLSSSVTQGIVSATGRTVSEGGSDGGTGATIPNMIQTSAAINPGNSGGALVNLDGQVIGIPTLAAIDPGMGNSAPGIGFAIPASMVKTVADQIIKDGKVTDSGRAALGITGRTVVDDSLRPAGVAVVEVKRGGAADKAGIQAGDVITRLGDTDITTITSLSEALAAQQPGDRTSVTFTRDGSEKKADVTLGEQ
ncbi:S1C family serine protease [Streptomyces cylindrosporus]|uniref:Trypsin-like peptidase domain-containing protein n=1 Tax=Streptomyces cylindrosporus TaxID=2927583 RepID=A0ABS9XZ69_9ACTN|nr:trypsin-like peptidase domain-containing protein [Streptomyces cylindrosporus]MCI3270267.1 trypsin-like peptidase domain-containing protein [Streptomyces cylindrosporus]